ncbi:MAG: TetM/TetW/TetO/TetS family tetracycline resistance ribosomal protection protein [Lachnospiraceae bacterium]|nr:TetM/TetW/TetO/TetS family tetracycline resistance ribosomal protection protein [Lachnospiraceae bacterium]
MDRKKLALGILAHVDAGKTTLAESMLYISGSIRKAGRVDHGDTFLDTDAQERTRGITIFSKQAEFSWNNMDVTLLDTPGHVDFSAEMERTLQVLDYAVLLISAADGVQGHVLTLWKLLERYDIPVFLFINKMDQPDTDRELLLKELQERLSAQCIDFTFEGDEAFAESLAVCDEEMLDKYLNNGKLETEDIAALIKQRKAFPCYFGSALKIEGVDTLLDGIQKYTLDTQYPDVFGARVYKIGRDDAGTRLTYMKITGGKLTVKQTLQDRNGEWEEKADQIRIYSGVKYTMEKEAAAGTVCAVAGLSRTFSGEGLGFEADSITPLLAPVLTYRIMLPEGSDVHVMYKELCKLEEEEPLLHIVWKEQLGEIHAQLMGEVQIEILKNLIANRLGVDVEFDSGSIVYKETISDAVEGVGHFEPLRHYAEVHLMLEPLEAGSGLVFDVRCSEDVLDKNWQRLVLTHLEEKEHIGVLTGSPITDMKITLIAGKAHLKHTEGGDFRQATYRAIRQGLCKAESILLEPVYEFRLELPSAMIGRAMSDIQAMHGRFDTPMVEGDMSILTGTVPVATMQGYQTEVMSYSGGLGRVFMSLKGYEPCHNAEEVIEKAGYDAESDLDNPPSSVFCAHGAGFVVPWYEVEDYMHVESAFGRSVRPDCMQDTVNEAGEIKYQPNRSTGRSDSDINVSDKELEEIFHRTYGNKEQTVPGRKNPGYHKIIRAGDSNNAGYRAKKASDEKKDEYLLVDGYNIIFAWEELEELTKISLDSARGRLMEILSNYQGAHKMNLILVFDAYRVKGNPGSVQTYHNIHVVYTKEAETADQYIEKVTHEIGKKHNVTVATSDGLEQIIIMGQGARRMSARELKEDIMSTNQELRNLFKDKVSDGKQYLFDTVEEELAEKLEDVRMGKREFDN